MAFLVKFVKPLSIPSPTPAPCLGGPVDQMSGIAMAQHPDPWPRKTEIPHERAQNTAKKNIVLFVVLGFLI